jgi:flagellar protein FliS
MFIVVLEHYVLSYRPIFDRDKPSRMTDMGFSTMLDNPYSDSLELRVSSATPLELVTILYDGAIDAVRAARRHLASGEIYARSRAVARAVNILIELTGSLNFDAGGDLSNRLAALYDFMQRGLLDANFRQTDEGLATTERLLLSLREAWAAVSNRTSSVVPSPPETTRLAQSEMPPAVFPWPAIRESASPARIWSA